MCVVWHSASHHPTISSSSSYARSLVDEVVRVHGHQILKMGLFNGQSIGRSSQAGRQAGRAGGALGPQGSSIHRAFGITPPPLPHHTHHTGDPHPGNLLLMPSGKLGLIDYGQIKRLKGAQRRSLARMIVALADGKREEVIDLFVQMGFKSKVSERASERGWWSVPYMMYVCTSG